MIHISNDRESIREHTEIVENTVGTKYKAGLVIRFGGE